MALLDTLTGRGWRVAGFVAALCCVVALTLACPGRAAAEGYESMMPEQLSKELRKAETEYRKVMEEVRAAENERLARKASGAAEAALADVDAELRKLLGKAEELKIKADYLDELYETKRREYKSK
jgi:hypothetical protein